MVRIPLILCLLLALLFPLGAPAEDTPAETVIPCPVISRRVPAWALVNNWSARSGNDDHYSGAWSGKAPDWLAYDLSGVPEENRRQVAAVWYNPSTWDQLGQWASRVKVPTDYSLELNAAPGGACPEEGWVTAVAVTGNVRGSRMHVLDMTGYNWIRLHVTAADGKSDGACEVNFDVHDLSGGDSDTWLFLGDSITAGAMNNCYGTGFATYVNRMRPAYFPLQQNGGIGGLTSRDGAAHISDWLADFPGRYVVIAYGTNDAWGSVGAERYGANTAAMVEAVIAAGKVPVVPKIPYAAEPAVLRNLAACNAQIDRIWERYPQVIPGPDFAAVFQEHPEYLGPDGVHPTTQGYENMRRIWAQTMVERLYPAPKDGE